MAITGRWILLILGTYDRVWFNALYARKSLVSRL